MRLPEPMKSRMLEAIQQEEAQMYEKGVWEISDMPHHTDAINTTWVLLEKYDAEGNFIKCKARLVARGFRQRPGRDYEETYAPTPRMATVRLALTLIMALNLEPRQIDVVGAYLEAPLNAEIYLKSPDGIKIEDGKVLRLRKAMYGLKQAGREFADYRDEQLSKLNYKRLHAEPAFFFRVLPPNNSNGKPIFDFTLWWVDNDLSGFTNDEGGRVQKCVDEIGELLPIEDKGIPTSYLGMALGFNRNDRVAYAYQPGLIDQIVKACRMEQSKPVVTPIRANITIEKNNGPPFPGFHNISYASVIGAINFISCCTRPDICNAVRILAAHSSNPSKKAWKQLNQLVTYLKTTRNWVLCFGLPSPYIMNPATNDQSHMKNSENLFTVYTDADWAQESDRISISGFISFLIGSPLNWSSKKQKGTIALSSMESEVVAACHGIKDAAWLKKIWGELDPQAGYPVNIGMDNQAAIYFGNANVDHTRVKHIDLRYYYIKDKVNDKTVKLWYCPSSYNPADLFTKPLPCDQHLYLMRMIGLCCLEEVC